MAKGEFRPRQNRKSAQSQFWSILTSSHLYFSDPRNWSEPSSLLPLETAQIAILRPSVRHEIGAFSKIVLHNLVQLREISSMRVSELQIVPD